MKNLKTILQKKIELLWKKPCNNASDAHFKAEKLTYLQNKLSKL